MSLQKSRRSCWVFMFVAILAGARLSAQSSAPQAYSLTEITNQTEASMFTGQPSTVKIYRSDSKELVEITITPWSANPKGVHMSYLFDFAAHKAYTRDLEQNACSWMKYVSPDAPVTYDPITGSQQMMPKLAKSMGGAVKVVGTESLNGIPARIEVISFPSMPGVPDMLKAWIAEEGGFAIKFVGPAPGTGKPETTFEIKQLSFARPPASVFAAPTGCSETQGEWSDTGVNAQSSTEANAQSGSAGSEASQAIAKETGGNAGDFVKAIEPPGTPSSASCTVLFRVVQAVTMAPITSGYGTGLDLNQSFSGSKTTVKEDMQGNVSFSGGTIRDVMSQFQNGILRIPDAPPHFTLDVEFGQANGGTGYTALIYRQCFRPETVLLLVINNKEGSGSGDWLWVKSGKYSTIAASQATAAASTPANLVTNGGFESGNTGFSTGYTYGNVSGPGAYWVGKNALQAPGAYKDWYNGGDHTTGTGNMLVVNGANSATTPVWEEVVPVTPNTAYTFSYWGAGVDHSSNSLPHLQLKINGSSVGSNNIPKNSPDNGGKWENFTFTWNSGSSTSADLALFDLNTETNWNDFALDDISFGANRPARSTRTASRAGSLGTGFMPWAFEFK
jgi:hypothetical protein